MNDYYKILGIERSASEDDIKKAYRRLAHKYHPDKGGGDEAMFKKINEAYQVLSNKDKRMHYDQFGRVFDHSGHAPGGGGFDPRGFGGFSQGEAPFGWQFGFDANGFEDAGNLGDIFDAFFEGLGVKRKRRSYERGSDVEIVQEISLEEAFRGAVKPVAFKTFAACGTCEGLGHFPKEGFSPCAACDGRGEVQESRRTFFGNFSQVRACAKCAGAGKIPNKPCSECGGKGRVTAEKKLEISIAPGIHDNQLIKVPRAGEVGARGAEAGDLYVRVRVTEHPMFRREGDDLRLRMDANLIDLLMEKHVQVPTISGGKVRVDVPPGYRIGDELAAAREGMPKLGGSGRGRLLIKLDIRVPKKISAHAKELLEKLKKEVEE